MFENACDTVLKEIGLKHTFRDTLNMSDSKITHSLLKTLLYY